MTVKTAGLICALVMAAPFQVSEAQANVDGLYGAWCMTGMATEIDGERVPDKASYTFTKDNVLKYDAGVFQQEEAFSIENGKIRTNSMGNYKIVSIESKEMVLNYGGYMFFSKGACS